MSSQRSLDIIRAIKELAQDRSMCIICVERPRESVLVPCGHHAMCMDCTAIYGCDHHTCPICRAPVREFVQIRRV